MSSAGTRADLSLQCHIEAESEYQLGKPITVKGTLHNSGASPIWILSWYTFLEPDWQNCLSVSHNGSPVPYTGVTATRSTVKKESFVRLAPGESRSRQIDIGERYDITEPGEYQVFFRLTLMATSEVTADGWPGDAIQYQQPIPLKSEKNLISNHGCSIWVQHFYA